MQFVIFLEFLFIAFAGMMYHYREKRYDHMTTSCSLYEYIFKEQKATMKAAGAIIVTCFGAAALHASEWYPNFAEIGLIFGAGYGFDNKYNKAPDAK
jgi:hypothetical protein